MKNFTPVRLLMLVAVLVFAGALQAQNPWSYDPGPVWTESMSLDSAEDWTIYINNDLGGNNNLSLDFEIVENSLDSGWQTRLCTNVTCYFWGGFNVGKTDSMFTFGRNNPGFFKLQNVAKPGESPGTGVLKIRTYLRSDPTQDDTVTYNVTRTSGSVNIADDLLAKNVQVFPNPATNEIHLRAINGLLDVGNISLLSITGSLLMETEVNATSMKTLDVATLPAGMYFMRYETRKAVFTEKVFIQ